MPVGSILHCGPLLPTVLTDTGSAPSGAPHHEEQPRETVQGFKPQRLRADAGSSANEMGVVVMKPGVFCLEGEWQRDLRDNPTVEPILQLLKSFGVVEYIHRDEGTRAEIEHYVKQWTLARYRGYPTLFIAAHGDIDTLAMGFGKANQIALYELQDLLAGKCKDRIIYFGACSVFDGEESWLMEFAKITKAKAIVGYRQNVPSLECAAFEAMLLQRIVRWGRTDTFVRDIVGQHAAQAQQFGLTAATSRKVYCA